MKVKDLKLINFRNYENIDLELNNKINVFVGKNAQGKTNLVEAIYMCSKGSSFRTNRDREMINFDKDEAYIGCNIDINNYNRFIELKLDRSNPKIIRINRTPLETQKELNSGLNIVVFSPEDLRVVKEGPANRRDFIDQSIAQMRPVYIYNLREYNKILYQRNNILKSNRFKRNRKNVEGLLEAFDIQMVKIATNILIERRAYVDKLQGVSEDIHKEITSCAEVLGLVYQTNICLEGSRQEIEERYLSQLKLNVEKDLDQGTTGLGPHRDDLLIDINGNSARTYGSQGQQRSVILSLKLSEVEILKMEKGSYPVLLLDDVYSELDMDRRKYLTGLFNNMQTLITTSNSESLDSLTGTDKSVFYIEEGNIINRR